MPDERTLSTLRVLLFVAVFAAGILVASRKTVTYFVPDRTEPWCYVHYVTEAGFEEIRFRCRGRVPGPNVRPRNV